MDKNKDKKQTFEELLNQDPSMAKKIQKVSLKDLPQIEKNVSRFKWKRFRYNKS